MINNIKIKKIIFSFVIFYFLAINHVNSEEELVITATRANSKLSETPFSVNTI